jgi:nitroreductase/NAD-dependent dihydropyrimidine dehydrogenase PreA subunit
MNNKINQEICNRCKLCIEVCPGNIIGLNENEEVYFIHEREIICLKCGQCMAICNTKAMQRNDISYNNQLFELPENEVFYKEWKNFLATRRSIRNFKDKPVPKEMIQQIIDSIAFAPYSSSSDEVSITVVNNRKAIESALPLISEFLGNIVEWIDNPFIRFMIKRKKGIETFNTIKNHIYPIAKLGNYKLEYGDRITRNAPAILIFHGSKCAEGHTNDSLIYATYAMLSAHSLGLGATMIGLVPAAINKIKKVKDIFQIPEDNEAVISIVLGYPKYKYKRAVKREKKHIFWID